MEITINDIKRTGYILTVTVSFNDGTNTTTKTYNFIDMALDQIKDMIAEYALTLEKNKELMSDKSYKKLKGKKYTLHKGKLKEK